MRSGPVLTILALALLAGTAHAQVAADPAKVALIQRLLDVTKSVELAVTALETSLPSQRQANPQIPAEFWDEFAKRARQDVPRFVQLLIPIYDRQFTAAQLNELLAFYQSPLGQHFIKVQPTITVQSIQAGQQWGAQIGAEVAQELQKRGVRTPPE
jgi:uncharacterized protein